MTSSMMKANTAKVAPQANFENRTLFHGDNLLFLRTINTATVDLIATDPPFNKGRDFHATPDSLADGASFQDRWSWKKDVHDDWVRLMRDDWPSVWAVVDWTRMVHSDAMAAFLCFMAVRLTEMRRVLKPTGSIYLHCDHSASHYLKTIMDAIFGYKNFRNDIAWSYRRWPSKSRAFQRMHDNLLYYTKTDNHVFNVEYEPVSSSYLRRFKGKSVTRNAGDTKVTVVDKPSRGMPLRAVWDISILAPASKERVGHPTQKPLALYRRMIRASSNKGDVVLDPFCGCATTPIAAELEGRQWIGMDLWKKAPGMVKERLAREIKAGNLPDGDRQTDMHIRKVTVRKEPLVRTDEG